MDYYFQAVSDEAALQACDLPAGPTAEPAFLSIEAKDVLACPHLEQLVAISLGKAGPSLVPKLVVLWPLPSSPEPLEEFCPDPAIMRLPDELRDDLAMLCVDADVAQRWAAEMCSYDADRARSVAHALVTLAQSARDGGHSLYWWSEL